MIIKSTGYSHSVRRGIASIKYTIRQKAYSNSLYKDQRGELYYGGEELVTKEKWKELKRELEKNNYERRLVFSCKEKEDLRKEDFLAIVRDTLEEYKERHNNIFQYTVVLHDHNNHLHAHVTIFSENRQGIYMDRHDFKEMREKATELERYYSFGVEKMRYFDAQREISQSLQLPSLQLSLELSLELEETGNSKERGFEKEWELEL